MKLNRITFRPGLRRAVFWVSLAVMFSSAVVGMAWRLLAGEWGRGPVACLALGAGAFLVAIVFRLLELANPTYHPESHMFSWDDVEALRLLSRRHPDNNTRDWARSLADRIAVVLPGRAVPPVEERKARNRNRRP